MPKLESVEGKKKSTAYLQGCLGQRAIKIQQHGYCLFLMLTFLLSSHLYEGPPSHSTQTSKLTSRSKISPG